MLDKIYLDQAFDSAVTALNPTEAPDEKVMRTVILNGMHYFLEQNNYSFSEEDIVAKLEEGLKSLASAGDDFKFNNWAMPR